MKNLFLVVFLILLTSCGMDTNGGGPSTEARGIAGQICNGRGSTYLATYHFAGQPYNQSAITVNSNSTGGAGGNVDQYFEGINSFGDVLVVSKMSSGQFDVALSLCAVNALSPDSVLTSAHTYYSPIVLGVDNSNRTGTVIVVNMYICANIYHNNYQTQSCSYRSFYSVSDYKNSNYY